MTQNAKDMLITTRRWLLRGLYALFAFLLIVATVLTLLLTTQTGTRASFAMAAWFVPGELEYEKVEGTLLRDFTVTNLSLQMPFADNENLTLNLGHLHVRWRPWALMDRQVHVRELELHDTSLVLPASAPQESTAESIFPIELPDIYFPWQFRLDQSSFSNITVIAGAEPVQIERAHLRARTRDDHLIIHSASLTMPDVHVQLHGQISPQQRYAMSLNSLVRFELPDYGFTTITGQLNGDAERLSLQQQVSGFVNATINIDVLSPLTEALTWQGHIRAMQSQSGSLLEEIEWAQLELQGEGSLTHVAGELNVRVEHRELGELVLNTQARYADLNAHLDSLFVRADELGVLVDWQGQADITPGAADEPIAITLDMGGPLRFQDYIDADVTITYRGSNEHADVIRFHAQQEEFRFTIVGHANWRTIPEWEISLVVDPVDVGFYVPEFPGFATVELVSKGSWGDVPEVHLDIATLSAELLNQRLSGSGDIQLRGDRVTLSDFELAWGEMQVNADAQVDLTTQTVQGDFSARDLEWEEWQLESLQVQGLSLNWLLERLPVANIELTGLHQSGNTIVERASLALQQVDGQPHQVALAMALPDTEFRFAANGHWQDSVWRGDITDIQLDHPEFGNYRLQRTGRGRFGADRVDLAEICVNHQERNAGFCFGADWDLESQLGQVSLQAEHLQLELLQPFLPDTLVINGELNSYLTLLLQPDQVDIEGSVHLSDSLIQLPEQDIRVELAEGEVLTLKGDESLIQARLNLITRNPEGYVRGDLELADILQQGALSGTLNLALPDLGFVSVMLPQLQGVRGNLNGELAVSGTLTQPIVQGELLLADAAGEIPAAGVAVHDLNVAMVAPGDLNEPFTLRANARSGDGFIELEGDYHLLDQQGNVVLRGERFLAIETRDIRVVITPDLRVNYTPELIVVRGDVTIPSALISPPDFETIDSSSRDTVIITNDETVYRFDDTTLPIDANVQVTLGDDVRVEAFGFAGQLTGRLRLIELPNQPTSAVGNINVATGRYEIFGQALDIERGSLIFTGGSVENPGLDLRVTRAIQTDSVTVGAQVGGSLREPTLNFFSTPAMQDSMILSYLILGRAPGEGSGEQNLYAQAALALGMRGGNFIGQQIGQAIGVDEIMLDSTGDNMESASLYIGKHLSSRLYIRYGIGLVEPVNTFFIRYRLRDNLNFESRSDGENSGADIFYTIER